MANTTGTDLAHFHVAATGHSLNYLPEYIAQRRGFFEARGLRVTASVPSPWDLVLDNLADGSAAAALGGIWVPSMYRGRGTSYTPFAQMSNKAPLSLLRRTSSEKFKVEDMQGRTILMKSGNGASVGLFMKMFLREHGVDAASGVDYIQDLDGVMLAKLFRGGMGDFLITDSLTARIMAATDKTVQVAVEMAVDGGVIPWSVYYCETERRAPDVLDRQRRFCEALQEAMDWIHQHDAADFQDDLAALFPAAPLSIVVDLTNVYREQAMWTTPVISLEGFARWQKGIASGRLVVQPLAYQGFVDGHTAESAVKVSQAAAGTPTKLES